jgi:hypothetical protein
MPGWVFIIRPPTGVPTAVHLLICPQLIRHYLPRVLTLAFFVLYRSWPTVHSTTRLSPVLA